MSPKGRIASRIPSRRTTSSTRATSTVTSGFPTGRNSGRAPWPSPATSRNATSPVQAPSNSVAASGCPPSSPSPAAPRYWPQTITRRPWTSPSTTPAPTWAANRVQPSSTGARLASKAWERSTSFSPPTFSTNARTPPPSPTWCPGFSHPVEWPSSPTPAATKLRFFSKP